MPKKISKSKKATKKVGSCSKFCQPSTWLIAILAIAFMVVACIATYAARISKPTALDLAKLETFDHISESYIRDMEFTSADQPTMKSITGYGVSDEDGVFYITFDFVPYSVENNNRVPESEPRHAIIYFWKDAERGTYSHAFSYHDDANYHPNGTYVDLRK